MITNLGELLVTQNGLRNYDSIAFMVNYVQLSNYFTKEALLNYEAGQGRVPPLIQIVEFEDGLKYVHDGHHRIVSCFLAQRFYLIPEEYQLSHWKYQDYLKVSHKNGWYTPFDPRIHVRLSDFRNFKKIVRDMFLRGDDGDVIFDWINENTHLYRTERTIQNVSDLANLVSGVLAG